MSKPDERAAIILALLETVHKLPQCCLERFGAQVRAWTAEGKTTEQIAKLIAAQLEAAPRKQLETLKPEDFYTIEAHDRSGPLRAVESHILGKDVNRAKRRMSRDYAEEGERLRFVVLREGIEPRRVGEYTKASRAHRIGSYKDRR